VLREQRLDLVQRELLLDTMVQNTPVAMLLVATAQRPIVYANLAARQLLNDGRKLEGHHLNELLASASPALREAAEARRRRPVHGRRRRGRRGLSPGAPRFSLNGRRHELLLLRQLTAGTAAPGSADLEKGDPRDQP
jgi:two-component system nitrogen regulation sensor histidine kinase NtrY